MFYSQFILAKKGPLGTIWIAAHLERKLRKNQVADTDIGVSVDSILSPEVPIALRLSSHLLLGVVRIYSRKVNYLFNDCSEALLKIKQAFRSTAVDLPPEESTAPYHSITLPETFDLDGFELPESAFQGNFVDHHVSTREQITLQDSVDGLGYSTSQFGLDERFGDGDASQIRLDLDEDLFLDNNSSVQHASVQLSTEDGMLHQDQPFIPPTNMDVDEGQEGCDRHTISETSKDLSELLSNDYEKTSSSTVGNIKKNDASLRHRYNVQTPDLNEVFLPDNHTEGPSAILDYTACAADDAQPPALYECAEAPSTPRLTEEAIPASVQEIPALSPQEKTHLSTAEPIECGISTSPQLGIVNLDVTNNNDPTLIVKLGEPVENAPSAAEAIDANTSTSSRIKLQSLDKEKSNSPIFGERIDPGSAASASSTLEAFGPNTSACPKLKVVSFDMTENDETLSDMRMVIPAGNAQVAFSAHSVLTDPRPANVGPECSVDYLDGPDRFQLACGQKSDDSNRPIFGERTDTGSAVSASSTLEAFGPNVSACPKLKVVSFDMTENDETLSDMRMVITAGNAQVAFSAHSVLTDPRPANVGPECSVDYLDGPDRSQLACGQKSDDSNRPIFGERTDPGSAVSASSTLEAFGPNVSACSKLKVVSFDMTENDETLSDMRMVMPAGNAQVASSANSVLTDPRPANVGPECSVEYIDGPDRSQLACGQTSDGILSNGIICNKVDNLPIVLDSVKVVLPEVTSCDGPVASSCFGEASNAGTPLDKPPIHCMPAVGSHNNIVLPETTSDFNCCSVVKKSDQLIPGAQVQVETCSEFFRREPCAISEANHLEEVHQDIGSFIKGQGIMPDVSGSSFVTKADKLIWGNEAHMDDVVSCLISNTSAVSSDYFLKPCNSFSNQTNVLPSGPGKSVNTAPEFSHREPYMVSEEANMVKASHTSGSFVEVQGNNNRKSTAMETSHEMHQKLESALPGFQPDVCRPDEQINDPLSKVAQFGKLNCFSSSYPEPEKMLLSPTGGIKLLNDLRQLTAEKSAAESAGSFDRISSLSGRKRHLIDTTPVQQIGSSSKVLGVPRAGRNASYVPADDDLLASILVGRTPELRMAATPPPTKIATRKRPRLVHKIGVLKRKVLLDDTMVLHADAIRQQLMNTEDIRRVRKKAPCTRSEIWMIEKMLTEEEIFRESLSTGISASLTSLYCRTYNEKPGFQVGCHISDEYFSYVQLSKELEHSRSLEFVRESTGNEMGKTGTTTTNEVDGGPSTTSAPGELDGQKNDIKLGGQKELESCPLDLEQSRENQTGSLFTVDIGMVGTSVTSVSNEANICNAAVEIDMREKLESCSPQLEQPSISQAITVSAVDITAHEIPEFEMPSVCGMLYGNEHKIPADSVVEDTLLRGSNIAKSPPNKCHTICINQEQEPVLDLVQPSEKSSEMSEGAFNLGDAPVEGTVSGKDAMECREVDRIALPSVNDGTPVQDACVTSDVLQEGNIGDNDPQRLHEDVGRIENGDTLVSLLDRCLLKDVAGLPVDSATVAHSNSSISPMAIENDELNELATVKGNQAMEEKKDGDLAITLDGEDAVQRMSSDEERHGSETTCSEKPEPSCPHQANIEIENIPSAVGENSGMQESNLEGGLDVESAPMDLTARESSDFCSAVDGNDTGFLNVDDEADFDEEADDDVPNPEEAQSLENSGWSSRTRGVARYLKALFDEEFGRGRKAVAMDHLLGGKTRKEASRMFFETLVLKTKDYVHVEQEKPFDSISIKPRPKLLKSDF